MIFVLKLARELGHVPYISFSLSAHSLKEINHRGELWENRREEVIVTEKCDIHTPPEVVHDGSNEREGFALSRNDN